MRSDTRDRGAALVPGDGDYQETSAGLAVPVVLC
jgi:hypothetical protein